MEFKIDEFNFTAVINGNGFLTSLTATRDEDENLYVCKIKLTAETDPGVILCCLPNGTCSPGSC